MFTVHNPGTAVVLCVLTMIGWGSWANTQKLAGREKWPFELFYWDYALGVALMGALLCASLGMNGMVGMSSLTNLHSAAPASVWKAVGSGAVFNLANILLVAAIDAACKSMPSPFHQRPIEKLPIVT